jgi:two-component system, NarL family, sensor kinase
MSEKSGNIVLIVIAFSLILLLLAILLITFIVLQQRKKIYHLNEKKNMQSEFQQALLQTQIEIQEQTLKTISQEIHDNIGQVLSLAKLNLNTLQPNDSIKLNDTKQLVSKAINDLRDLSRSLHGDKIAELGLQESIANELKILQNTGQYQTHLNITGNAYKLASQTEMVLFRIVQEALNNIVKHAQAKNIKAYINYKQEVFSLVVEDDGVGFESNELDVTKTGIGLKSMQNRVGLIGGSLQINAVPKKGATILVEIKR